MLKDESEYRAFQTKWMRNEIEVSHYKHSPDFSKVYVDYQYAKAELGPKRRARLWLAGAAFITAYGRLILMDMAEKLQERVLYHDTDSIIFEYHPDKFNIPEGRYLGDWECETAGSPIVKFVSIGPKCYAYVTADGQVCCKVKGVTMNVHNDTKVNFEEMKALVLKEKEFTTTKNLTFVRDAGHGNRAAQMLSGVTDKIVRLTYTKGVVSPGSTIVFPKGVDALSESE